MMCKKRILYKNQYLIVRRVIQSIKYSLESRLFFFFYGRVFRSIMGEPCLLYGGVSFCMPRAKAMAANAGRK